MAEFDPRAFAGLVRSGRLSAPTREERPRYGARGAWRAGTEALRLAFSCWWVGERTQGDRLLVLAWEWLQAPEDEGRPWGDPPAYHEARHRQARALAAWAAGEDDTRLWAEAADAIDAWLAVHAGSPSDDRLLDAGLCRWMSGANPVGPWPPSSAGDLLRALADGEVAASAFGEYLRSDAARHVAEIPDLTAATLHAAAFGRSAQLEGMMLCFLTVYALVPALPLPPALTEAGWKDTAQANAVVPVAAFALIDRLMPLFGLARDPDAIAQTSSPPAFASWTRHPDFGLELDWHAPHMQTPWVEIRGEGAGRLAAFLAEAAAGRIAPSPDEALADLLTVAPGAPASTGNGELRWTMLAALLANPGAAQRNLAASLIAAGLRDPDWRVRMAALWGVGALRLTELAGETQKVKLPPVEFAGLGAEDRHTLLALRELAQLRAEKKPIASGRTDRKAAFLTEIDALFDAFASRPRSRSEALLMALLRRSELTGDLVPRAWKSWWAPP